MIITLVFFGLMNTVVGQWSSGDTLTPGALLDSDQFGYALTMSGNKMAVGAAWDDGGGTDAGAVYTYQWGGSSWVEDSTVLSPSTLLAGDYFGRALTMSGDKLAVGAFGDDGAGSNAGAVYTYQWNGTAWVEDSTVLSPPALVEGDFFGFSLSMDGDRLVVGAQGDDGGGSSRGAVYTYQWSGTAWVQDSTVLLPDELRVSDSYAFGRTVSLSGNRLAVGAQGDDVVANGAGAVYTYQWNGTAWVQDSTVLTPGELLASDLFGYRLTLAGDKLAVGAYGDDGGGTNAGAVYTFHWGGSSWVRDPPVLRPLELQAGDSFSEGITMSGNRLAVGAHGDSSGAGAVYTYQWNGTAWVEDPLVPPGGLLANDRFGFAVTMDGEKLAVGAYGDDGAGVDRGAVYTFSVAVPTSSPSQSPTSSPTVNPTAVPSTSPSATPSQSPTTTTPTVSPTAVPSTSPSTAPSSSPTTATPTGSPTTSPTLSPSTATPTGSPTTVPTSSPTTGAPTFTPVGRVIGSSAIGATFVNIDSREQYIDGVYSEVSTNFPSTSLRTLTTTVFVREHGFVTNTLFVDSGGNVALFKESVAAARCGNVTGCEVTLTFPTARLLQRDLALQIPVEITWTFDYSVYAAIDGFDFDDPAFIQSIRDAFGLPESADYNATGVDGEVTITFTLYEDSDGTDPLDSTVVTTLEELHTNHSAVSQVLFNSLRTSEDSLTVVTLNKCPSERTCNNVGTCDPATGVCQCTGDWWGIDCETACQCDNGGECHDAYCYCPFPFYGFRCHLDSGCGQCLT